MDYYNNSTDDVYRDVVQELTKENLKRLKEYIVESLKRKRPIRKIKNGSSFKRKRKCGSRKT